MQKTQRNKYLLKNTIVFALGNFGTKMISFFLVPLYTNILTTSEYGIVDLIYTIGTVLVPILTLNIGEAIMRFSLDKDSNREKIMNIGLRLLLFATVLGLAILPVSSLFNEVRSYVIYVYLYTVTLAYSQVFLCYLRGKELLVQYSTGNIIHTFCIAFFNIIFLLVMKQGIYGYLTAYILSNVITAIYAFKVGNVYKAIKESKIDTKLRKEMIRYSVVLIPNSFMWWIMNSSDRVMVTAMIGTAANGIYAVAYKIPTLLSTISTVFNQAWSYSAIRENESEDKEEYSNNVYDRLVSTVLITAIGLLMIIKIFLKFYVGEDYYTAWRYTPYLMIGFVFMTLGTFVSTSYTVHKDSLGFLVSGTIGALVNVILNFILIPVLGVTGAAVATGFSYFTVFCYRVYNTRKYLKINVFKRKHIVGYILLLVTAATMFLDNILGQVLLVVEFIVALAVFKEFWLAILSGIVRKAREKTK